MPIYEYQCDAKGHRFEEHQKVSSRPLQKCRVCGGKVRKLMSSTAFHLKGSGWYKTDYAGSKGTKETTETKVETKVETKKDSSPTAPAKKKTEEKKPREDS